MKSAQPRGQRGGFIIGLVVGLLIGLSIALGVALYVTKAPNPFVNKVPARTPGQEAAEIERNRNWDPNSALAGKNPAPVGASAPGAAPGVLPPTSSLPPSLAPPTVIDPVLPNAASAARPSRPSRPASGASAATSLAASAPPPAKASQGLAAGADPFSYFVQAGAFARSEDAEQQRARLALLGVESRLTEREQGGRTVYRVRVGPFDKKEDADAAKEKLGDAGVDSALVRVQR